MDFIEIQAQRYPELSAKYEELGSLFSRKLWHELTEVLAVFLDDESTHKDDNYTELYTEFISKFENRLSAIKLAQLVGTIGLKFRNPQKTVDFLTSILNSPRTKLSSDAKLFISLDIAIANVELGNKDAALTALKDAWNSLSATASAESVVYSKYYYASAVYRKVHGPPLEFLKVALMYLGYTPVDQIPVEQQRGLATELCIAAISSDEIYNFGEVVAAPVLGSLQGTPSEWLYDLVQALNQGNMERFNQVVNENQKSYAGMPKLSENHEVIKQKVILLSIMNLVFNRSAHDRNITFSEIASCAGIPLTEVEWAVMKAFSLKLIKGSINGITETVQVSWVQPRVLNKGHVEVLCSQLEMWTEKVKTALTTVEDHSAEL